MEVFSDGFLKRIEKLIIGRIDKLIEDILSHYKLNQMYLKKVQAKKYIGIGKGSLEDMIHDGLPVVHYGSLRLIDIRDIDKFMEERKVVECQELKDEKGVSTLSAR